MTDLDAGTKRELKSEIEALSQKLGAALPDDLERANKGRLLTLAAELRVRAGAPAPVTLPAPVPASVVAVAAPELEWVPELEIVEVEPEAPTLPPAAAFKPRPAKPTKPMVNGAGAFDGGKPPAVKSRGAYSYPYTVAEGKVVVTRRGKIAAYRPVRAGDFADGQTQLDELVAGGYVVKAP